MVYRPKIDDKLCFVLMPFGPPFDDYYEHIIKKAVKDAGMDALRADEIYGTGSIMRDVWDHIWRARVIVADVTDRNPNVNYELGLCHSLGVCTILMTQQIGDVPFDYRHRRCISYNTTDARWQAQLSEALIKNIEAALLQSDDDHELRWPYDTSAVRQIGTAFSTISVEKPQAVALRGMAEVSRLVSKAYGPRGTTVRVSLGVGRIVSQKKGLAIADGVHSANSIEENGIEQMRKVGRSIFGGVGDGTKTAMILAHGLVDGGQSAIVQGHAMHDVLRGMRKAVDAARSWIQRNSCYCGPDDLLAVARTASDDLPISDLVARAMQKVGPDGIIVVENGAGIECELSVQEGLRFDRGYLSPKFVTNLEPERCELAECRVLVHEPRISNMKDLLPLLEQIARSSSPLLVVADDIDGEALAALVVNNVRGSLKCAAVRAPGSGDRRRELLQDIAVLTGAKLFSADLGLRLESIRLEDLGGADKIVVTQGTTTIFGGHGAENTIQSHIEALRSAIGTSSNPYDRARLQERLANLAGKIATISIGGSTDIEAEDRQYRATSAMHSTRAAIEAGWSGGAGSALLNAKAAIMELSHQSVAEEAGALVVFKALDQPFAALAESCCKSPASLIGERQRLNDPMIGLDVRTGGLSNVRVAGILDPTKTLQSALEIALSYATEILKTDTWSVAQ